MRPQHHQIQGLPRGTEPQQANGSAASEVSMRVAYGQLSEVALFLLALPLLVYCLALAHRPCHRREAEGRQRKKAAASAASYSVWHRGFARPGARAARGDANRCPIRPIRELRHAYEASDLKPDVGDGAPVTPLATGSASLATGRAARSWRLSRLSWTPAMSCCRWAGTWKTTGSTSGPTSEFPLDKLSPAQEVELCGWSPRPE